MLLKLIVAGVVVLGIVLFAFDEDILSKDGENTASGIILRSYLVDRYRGKEGCLEIRTVDQYELWLRLQQMTGCGTGADWVGMQLAKGDRRLYYRIGPPTVVWDDRGARVKIGSAPAATPGVRMMLKGHYTGYLLDPRFGLGKLSRDVMVGQQVDGIITQGLIMAHEPGHLCGKNLDANVSQEESDKCAVEAENAFRMERGLFPLRERHQF